MMKNKSNPTRERSAGGVVYKQVENQLLFLLIKSSGMTKEKMQVWKFPKGLIDDRESTETAALREVKEEGGVEAKIVEDLGKIAFTFTWEGEEIAKTINYFLMEYVSGDPADHDHEVAEARWVALDEVLDYLYHDNEKEVFIRVEKLLEG